MDFTPEHRKNLQENPHAVKVDSVVTNGILDFVEAAKESGETRLQHGQQVFRVDTNNNAISLETYTGKNDGKVTFSTVMRAGAGNRDFYYSHFSSGLGSEYLVADAASGNIYRGSSNMTHQTIGITVFNIAVLEEETYSSSISVDEHGSLKLRYKVRTGEGLVHRSPTTTYPVKYADEFKTPQEHAEVFLEKMNESMIKRLNHVKNSVKKLSEKE